MLRIIRLVWRRLAGKPGAGRAAEFFARRAEGADAERAARWLEGRPA